MQNTIVDTKICAAALSFTTVLPNIQTHTPRAASRRTMHTMHSHNSLAVKPKLDFERLKNAIQMALQNYEKLYAEKDGRNPRPRRGCHRPMVLPKGRYARSSKELAQLFTMRVWFLQYGPMQFDTFASCSISRQLQQNLLTVTIY
jgi:hypothetical protein